MFPTEIYQIIFGILAGESHGPDVASLKNCMLASRELHNNAQEFLYTDLSIADRQIARSRNDLPCCLDLRCVVSLLDQRILITHRVQKLELYLPLNHHGLAEQVEKLLNAFTTLKSLSLDAWEYDVQWVLYGPPLEQNPIYYINTFPFFRTLVEIRICDLSRFPVIILLDCPNLKHLHIIDTSLEPPPKGFSLHDHDPLVLSSLTHATQDYFGFNALFRRTGTGEYQSPSGPLIFDCSQLCYLSIKQEHSTSIPVPQELLDSAQISLKHLAIDLSDQVWARYRPPTPLGLDILGLNRCPNLTTMEVTWVPSVWDDPFDEVSTLTEEGCLYFAPFLQVIKLRLFLEPTTGLCKTSIGSWYNFIRSLCELTSKLKNITFEVTNTCDMTAMELLWTFQEIETRLVEDGINWISFNGFVQ